MGQADTSSPRTLQHPQEAPVWLVMAAAHLRDNQVDALPCASFLQLHRREPLAATRRPKSSATRNNGSRNLNRGTSVEKHIWEPESCFATSTEVPRLRSTSGSGKPSTRLPSTGSWHPPRGPRAVRHKIIVHATSTEVPGLRSTSGSQNRASQPQPRYLG